MLPSEARTSTLFRCQIVPAGMSPTHHHTESLKRPANINLQLCNDFKVFVRLFTIETVRESREPIDAAVLVKEVRPLRVQSPCVCEEPNSVISFKLSISRVRGGNTSERTIKEKPQPREQVFTTLRRPPFIRQGRR